jgi:ubiquinone/menaquinone biosynthesis C-methylase UbiE
MQPDQDQVRKFYDENYYAEIKGVGNPTAHHRRLAQRLGITAGHRVLDVACGTGEWLQAAHERGAHVFGVDLSEKAISFCTRNNPQGKFLAVSAENLPFDAGSMDIVTCLGSLEHFPDKPAALAEMHRLLKPGAFLVISVPNINFLGYRLGLYRGTNQAGIIETPLRISVWEKLATDAGFTVEQRWRDLHFFSIEWMTRNGWVKALPRAVSACAIAALPLELQYQVYFLLGK